MSESRRGGKGAHKWWGWIIGVGIAGFALYMLTHTVDWRAALQYLRQVQLVWLVLALLSLLGNNIARALRWRLLFPPEQSSPPRGEAFGALMAGQLLNLTLPLRSGDISRAYFLGRHRGHSSAAAIGTIGAEKLLDLIIMGLLFTLILPHFILPSWMVANQASIWMISMAALLIWVGLIVGLPNLQAWLGKSAKRWPALAWPTHIAQKILDGFHALRHRQRLPWILLWTILAWSGSIFATYALLASLAIPASLPLAILANVIVQGGLSVPVAPVGLGVFEWLAILALSIAGVPSDQGLAYGMLTHAAVLVYPIIIGVPWLISRFR